MSDFILEYDILESIASYSNSLGKRSMEYSTSLEYKIIGGISSVTGPSSGYLESASDSVRDKINALKLKSEAFYRFSEQITNLLELAQQTDQEVADAIAAQREFFLEHHESLRIEDWKAKLLGLAVDIKNGIPFLGTIADLLAGLDTILESLQDSIKHWYECGGGKQIADLVLSVAEVGLSIVILTTAVAALALPGVGFFAACGAIGAGIAYINSLTNVATSLRAVEAAIDGNPAWALVYGKQDKLSDVLRQTNFGNGTFNTITNLSANAIDVTEIFCDVVGFAEIGVGVAKLFKKNGWKLLKNKGSMNFSDLNHGKKNGIVTLESNIKQGYANAGNSWSFLDFKVNKTEYTEIGEQLASIKDIRSYKKLMNEKGIKVVIDKKGKILPTNVAAGFNYSTGQVIIRNKPSLISLYHEGFHAQQYLELGVDKYISIGRLAREEYVYENIVKSNLFNEAELAHSEWYINKLRATLGGQ